MAADGQGVISHRAHLREQAGAAECIGPLAAVGRRPSAGNRRYRCTLGSCRRVCEAVRRALVETAIEEQRGRHLQKLAPAHTAGFGLVERHDPHQGEAAAPSGIEPVRDGGGASRHLDKAAAALDPDREGAEFFADRGLLGFADAMIELFVVFGAFGQMTHRQIVAGVLVLVSAQADRREERALG